MQPRQPSKEEIAALAHYWFRAETMHKAVHAIRDHYEGDLKRLQADGMWWHLETYLSFWLAALFVVVEGFNKLKMKDPRVQRLFKENLGHLKMVRHDTYHFIVKKRSRLPEMDWAEELHAAVAAFIDEHERHRASKKKKKE